MRWYYRHSGLQVESELHLPEWSAFETPPASLPDLRIFWSESPSSTRDVPAAGPKEASVTADSCHFFVPEAAEYRVSRTGRIEIYAVSSPDIKKVRVFLYGAAWAAFCYLQELTLLHASVVAIREEAVAFCGPSGAGKSSLAARMTMLGYPLVSDDLFRVDFHEPGRAFVYPSSTRLKLWREALTSLGIACDLSEQDHVRMDKYHLPLSEDVSLKPRPLAAVFMLTWGAPACMRLTGMAALRRLVGAATYRGDLLGEKESLAGHWTRCAELLRRVTVWELARPRDWAGMDAAVALVLTKMRGNQEEK